MCMAGSVVRSVGGWVGRQAGRQIDRFGSVLDLCGSTLLLMSHSVGVPQLHVPATPVAPTELTYTNEEMLIHVM